MLAQVTCASKLSLRSILKEVSLFLLSHLYVIIIFGRTFEEHLERFDQVKNWPVPANADELRSFVSFA